ncbi:MAG: DUF3078 domain-containing protein [Cyclobacteriaceae bacterium]|nr:DUF3078 domain-containing protein [Cyclobacteriaceae bacterium]
MKNILFLLVFFTYSAAIAQEADTTYWRRAFKGAITFNQASFSDNWTGGGVNSIGFSSLINFKANYLKGKNSWDNELDLLYGYINNQGTGYRKNNDRIYLDTKYGRALSDKWNMYGSFNILTQFANGFKYDKDSLDRDVALQVSEFMAPGFFTAALGFEYTPKPFFKLRLSPVAPRLTVVRNKELYQNVDNNYGVPVGETTRFEWLAFQLLADFDKNLNENVNLKFRYLIYANYETLDFNKIDQRLDAILERQNR